MAAAGGLAIRDARAGARRGGRRRRALARGVQGLDGAVRRAAARAARPARARRGWPPGCARCWPARRWSPRTPTAAGSRIPYTLRCAPQVLGAVADALGYVRGRAGARARRGHRQPARVRRTTARSSPAATSTASRCRCRSTTSRWRCASWRASPSGGSTRCSRPSYAELPAFLTPRPGLSSGLMIAQYAAAALVNECQVLSHPAGAGSIPTSAGMEDFNSMGALAALKARTVVGARRARRRHRARLRVPGARVPPPAAVDRRAGGARSRRSARWCRGSRRTAASPPSSRRSPARCGRAGSCSPR